MWFRGMHYSCWGQEDGGEELGIETNGGVLWGGPRPRRGCSAIDGWMVSLASLFYIPSQRSGCVHVGFVVDTVALRQVLIRVIRFSLCHYHSFNVPYLFVYHKYNINLSIGRIILVTRIFIFKPFFNTNNPLRLTRTSYYSAYSSFIWQACCDFKDRKFTVAHCRAKERCLRPFGHLTCWFRDVCNKLAIVISLQYCRKQCVPK
jgi:hypothetical protein